MAKTNPAETTAAATVATAEAPAANASAELEQASNQADAPPNGGADQQPSAPGVRSLGVFLRRENVDGVWYPHGAVIDADAGLCIALSADGALDLHPAAVQYALDQGAPTLKHEPATVATE